MRSLPIPDQTPDLAAHFWQRVQKSDGCWLWTDHMTQDGYGRVYFDAGTYRAHRVAYTWTVGPIPEGLQLDHLCRTRACVNPAHLEPVTQGENILRGATVTARNALAPACINGHEWTPENTAYRSPNEEGTRRCRECSRIRSKARKQLARHLARAERLSAARLTCGPASKRWPTSGTWWATRTPTPSALLSPPRRSRELVSCG